MENEEKVVCNDPHCALMKQVEKAFEEAFNLPKAVELQKKIVEANRKGEDIVNLDNELKALADEHMVKVIDDIEVAKSLLVNLVIARKSSIERKMDMARNVLNSIQNSADTIISVEISTVKPKCEKKALTARIDKSTFPFNEYLTLPEFLAKINFEPETPELPSTHQCLEAVKDWCNEHNYNYCTTKMRKFSECEPSLQRRVFAILTKKEDGEDATT